jgi:hypothetical protein
LSAGLGDPLRQSIQNATSFFDELRFNNQVLPQFQLKQVLTQNGEPLQTPYPSEEIRFLNSEEISALQEKTDSFRAYRFLNLRELSFPRLLSRQEFPYDARHRAQENSMGPPPLRDDLFYDVEKNQFVSVEPDIPAIDSSLNQFELPSQDTVESEIPVEEVREQNNIIEFLYDIFQSDDAPQSEDENIERPLELFPDLEP